MGVASAFLGAVRSSLLPVTSFGFSWGRSALLRVKPSPVHRQRWPHSRCGGGQAPTTAGTLWRLRGCHLEAGGLGVSPGSATDQLPGPRFPGPLAGERSLLSKAQVQVSLTLGVSPDRQG